MKKLTTCKICLIIIATFFILYTTGCFKKTTDYMPQEFKDYVIYPEGSYWIYEDSISGAIDSVALLSQDIYIAKENNVYYYETADQSFFSSYQNSVYRTYIEIRSEIYFYFFRHLKYNGPYILIYPFGHWGGLKYDFVKIMEVNNVDFNNVHVFNRQEQGIDNNIFYFTRNIGIIKRKVITTNNDTIIWELKKYHINN
jgi:hypothetical protein